MRDSKVSSVFKCLLVRACFRSKSPASQACYLSLMIAKTSFNGIFSSRQVRFCLPRFKSDMQCFYVCNENGFDHTSSCHFHLSTFRCCQPPMICSKVLKNGEKLHHQIFRHTIVRSDLQFILDIIFIMGHFIFTYKPDMFCSKMIKNMEVFFFSFLSLQWHK